MTPKFKLYSIVSLMLAITTPIWNELMEKNYEKRLSKIDK